MVYGGFLDIGGMVEHSAIESFAYTYRQVLSFRVM